MMQMHKTFVLVSQKLSGPFPENSQAFEKLDSKS